jgi:hypothetical protein
MVGNSIFFTFWAVFLTGPKYWWVGMYSGAFLGALYYNWALGFNKSKDT